MLTSNKTKIKRDTKKKNKRKEVRLVLLNEEHLIQEVYTRPVIYDRSLRGYRKTTLRKQCWSEISKAMGCTEEECRKRWRSLRDSFAKHYKIFQKAGDSAREKHCKWVFYDKMSFLIPHIDGVSYDLDGIIDELGDISDDGGSMDSDAIGLNSTSENLKQTALSIENVKKIDEHEEQFQENVQHTSVSVQATDFISIPIANPSQSPLIDTNHTCRINNTCSNTTFCGETNADSGIVHDSDEKFLLSCAPTLRRLTNRQNALARLKIQQILFDIEFVQSNS